jgi:hypothetical protein
MSIKGILTKNSRPDLWCIGLVVLTITAFHSKILRGRAIFPFDYEGYHYPLLHFIGHEIFNGRFPLYDPYVYSGLPLFLNTQSALFYPVHLLYFLVLAISKVPTTQYLMNWLGVIHFVLGGMFFYYLARHYDLRRSLATAGAILYSLNGHILAQAQHLGVIETFAWLPLLFLLMSRFLRNPNFRIAVGIAIVVSLLVLIGFLPQVVAVFIVLFVFCCARLVSDSSDLKRKLAGLLLAAVIVICLTAAVTVPLIAVDQPMEELGIHQHATMPFLKTLLWPNVFKTLNWPDYTGPSDPTITYLYAGLIIPVLVPFGLFLCWKKASELVILFVFSAAVAFSSAFYASGLYSLSPICRLVRPENFLYFLTLFGVLLSLLAIERLSLKPWVVASLIAVQSAVTIIPMVNGSLTKQDARVINATVIASLLLLLVLSIRPKSIGLISIVAAAHLFVVNLNCPLWTMRTRPGYITPDTIGFERNELLQWLKKSDEPYRVAIGNHEMEEFWNGSWRIWRIDSIGGLEPVRSQKYLDTVARDLSDWHDNRTFNIVRLDSPLLNLLNVRFFVDRNDYAPRPVPPQWRPVYHGFWNVYENQNFHSRYAVVPIESVRINQRLRIAQYVPQADRAGLVDSVAQEPGSIKLSINVQRPTAFLFISERNYHGWEITVDGRPVEPMTVNELLMGIPVVQGKHAVAVRFKMPHRVLVIALAALGLCLALAGFGTGWPKKAKSPNPSSKLE